MERARCHVRDRGMQLLAVPALAPGETFQVQRQTTLPPKNYRNTATADFTGVVPESSETNNTTIDNYTVSPGGGVAPDPLQSPIPDRDSPIDESGTRSDFPSVKA